MADTLETDILERHRLTAAQFQQMGKSGILDEDDRVELLDGELIVMTPIGPPHSSCLSRLTRLLVPMLGNRAIVRVQDALRVNRTTELYPDLTVVAPRDDFYARRLVKATDVYLVIEVADSSYVRDRKIKLARYAQAGIPEAWIVNLARQPYRVEVYRQPRGGQYDWSATYGPEDCIVPERFPDLTIAVREVLP